MGEVTEFFSRSIVYLVDVVLQLIVGKVGEVGLLEEVSAQEAVGVLVDAAHGKKLRPVLSCRAQVRCVGMTERGLCGGLALAAFAVGVAQHGFALGEGEGNLAGLLVGHDLGGGL